jgi:hypothetical protein
MIPDSQLLRLKDWFSKYQFTVEHVKGKTNVLANFLSRLKSPSSLLISYLNKTIPLFMISHHCPLEIQQFSSLVEVYSFAHTKLSHYRSLFVNEYQAIHPDNFHNHLLYGPFRSNLKPYDSILTISVDYTLSENGFWYL